ncbi:MAG: hypothetical protein BWX90_00578 [bacterium ADurb.Bin132]|nr:MAG: hypothetical protein BWX90_00578 [bacterium ADurb.Bin132]
MALPFTGLLLVVMERFSIVTSPDWRMKAWLTSEVIMVSWAGFIPFPDPTILIAFVIVRLSLYAPGATWIVELGAVATNAALIVGNASVPIVWGSGSPGKVTLVPGGSPTQSSSTHVSGKLNATPISASETFDSPLAGVVA